MDNREEAFVCPLEEELSPGRKALLYLAMGAGIVVCIFFFWAACTALLG